MKAPGRIGPTEDPGRDPVPQGAEVHEETVLRAQNHGYFQNFAGMLIDLEVFDIQDIIEILKNEQILKERVQEAEILID